MKPENQPQNIRERVIDFLLFLSSEEHWLASRRLIAPELLAFELSRLWFNEIYAPGRCYLESLKGDFSQEKAQEFRNYFSDEEMESLERFHRFFELRIEMLPEAARQQGIFPESDAWRNVMRHAAYLAEELEPDAEKRRSRLAKYLRKALTNQERLPERPEWKGGPAPAERTNNP